MPSVLTTKRALRLLREIGLIDDDGKPMEAEWVTGPSGAIGEKGDQGEPGPQGPEGPATSMPVGVTQQLMIPGVGTVTVTKGVITEVQPATVSPPGQSGR